MKSKLYMLCIAGCVALLFGSCKSLTNFSIEKRQHRGGYYVDWGNGKVKTEPALQAQASKPKKAEEKKAAEPVKQAPATPEKANTTPAEPKAEKPAKPEPLFPHNLFKVAQVPMAQREKVAMEMAQITVHEFNNYDKEKASETGGQPTWLMVILCIFVPPLAIALAKGIGTPFWIDLILWLLGFGAFGAGALALFWLAAIIYAVVIIF